MKVLPYITSRYGKRLFAVAVLVVTYSSPDTPLALLYRRLTIS
ncbi:hypothetical protein JOD64_005288 [Micromonospora luteifusca]|uniref:Uncharacterized protein n=1 Tax=Micromonospora luteifusca TaxID=709860 RepID=A0ABS2M0T4_9ACTN|nr:hypothetical protein [Micromonospora luteifusca]MBM7494066.1 hypothetical protein [Micromonospora luteifusca]